MSIDLGVKLGTKTVHRAEYLSALSLILQTAFSVRAADIVLSDNGAAESIGLRDFLVRIDVERDACISISVSSIGTEEEYGEDGGWWATLEVELRTEESVLLLALASACLARSFGTSVLDDSGLFKRDRFVESEWLLSVALASSGVPFSESAHRFCQQFGLSCGMPE